MDPLHSHPDTSSFLRQIGSRLSTAWVAKMTGTTLGMTTFFVIYFWLLRHPLHAVTTMPLTVVDTLISFQPLALPVYLSLWFYVSLAPALITDRRELVSYGLAAVILSAIGLGCFFFWPTTVPPAGIEWTKHSALEFLKSADAGGNACPSLHVAFAVFSAIWFERLLRQMQTGRLLRTFNWLWCIGILYSTMAIHQHVSLDVLAGAVLGVAIATGHLRWLNTSA